MPFEKLRQEGNSYFITRNKRFNAAGILRYDSVQSAFDFAFNMTFGERGEHRDHRSGGTHKRKKGEIFCDTFQGKLSECALCNTLYARHKGEITIPSFEVMPLGKWDQEDFIIGNKRASVKSTKSFGHLMLLEKRDFDEEGRYIPNLGTPGEHYDFYVLVRIDPSCDSLLMREKLLKADKADYNALNRLIQKEEWKYDVPGYISKEDFLEIIRKRIFIPQGAYLNGKTRIDADNYYVQAGDLKDINQL